MTMQKLPQQIDTVPENRAATAPYNFVPLPEKVVSAELPLLPHDAYHADRHTGRIECTLTTESPLYVRCGYTPEEYAELAEKPFNELTEEQKRKRAQFFTLGNPNAPTIPGSSLRGMLRALVEIASYGKMDRVTDRQHYFFRAVAAKTDDPLARPYRDLLESVRAGYLVQRGQDWFIRSAQTIGTDTFIKVRESDIPRSVGLIRMNDPNYRPQYIEVSFTHKRTPNGRTVVDRIDKPGVHPNHGWLVTSGNMLETNRAGGRTNRKNHVVVLESGNNEIPIDPQAITDYRSGLTEFQKGPTDVEPPSKRPFSEQMGMLANGRPVFYCEPARGKPARFFGHSPNFRVPYWRNDVKHAATPANLIPTKIRRGLEDKDQPPVIDIAEAIFGHVSRNSKEDPRKQIAGRVFVGDGLFVGAKDGLWLDEMTPQILATPKPTTFQHYLVQTSETNADQRKLMRYDSSPEKTTIRGHKLYWHKGDRPEIGLPSEQQETNESQKTRIRPVKPGTIFTFVIHFENLSDVELGALLWVLQIAADERYRLKLGMGKPLGMGAVKIESKVVLSKREDRYATLFNGDGWASGERIMPPEEEGDSVTAFGQYVLKESGEAAKGNARLSNTLRIRCLLALLSWPGPNPKVTRYMKIERDARHPDGVRPGRENNGKVNEYSNRLVLPTPTQVMAQHRPEQPRPAARPISTPRAGNDRQGRIKGRDGRIWIVELEGGFVVRATLSKNIQQRPGTGDSVVVRITGQGDTGEIRKLLSS